jgi:hypothetical protein
MSLCLQPKIFFLTAFVFIAILTSAQKSVLTQHNDNNRTGWYDSEKLLNKKNVHAGSFGKIFTRIVDDQVYAQPLVKLNLNIPGKGNKNIVFVATVNNTVYAFDADSANVLVPYWKKNLTPEHARVISKNDETGACGGYYNDFSGNMGIVGTPVIDSTINTMYVVARSVDTTGGVKTFKQYLHALDITTGTEKLNSPVLIAASVDGNGDGSSGGKVFFSALHNNQRGGLLLSNGIVYIAWSSHCDWGPYHGWLMGYDKTTLQQKYVYASTPDGYNGGIWMSGGGPSADADGNIYLAAGNGSVGKNGNPADLRNRSESALKLFPSGNSFNIQSYFTPTNYETLEGADLDFGVTQVMLVPNTNRAMVGVKDGHIYVLNKDNMGGYNASLNNVVQTIDLGSNSFLRSAMSYFKGSKEYAYSWSENSLLRAYPYNRNTSQFDLNNTVISGLQGPAGNNGAVLSVSSNASADSTGILWASYAADGDANQSVRPGILRAIDASDVTKELWNSSIYPDDNPGNYAKFNCPTIVNGKVYLATFSNQLVVYGLTGKSADSCSTDNIAKNKSVYASSVESNDYAALYAVDGNVSTRWSSQFNDPQSIYVDLGKRYNVCRVVLHWEIALGQDFKIQVSDNASDWTDVATITGNTSYVDYLPVHASGRYVRMYGTKRGTVYGYSLWEFEVNGTPADNNCAPPVDLHTTDIYESSATLHWSNNNVSNYVVQYKTVTAINWNQKIATTNNITLNDLSCNTPYLYRIQAVCTTADSSEFSIAGGFTTLECNINCDPLPTRWSTEDIGNVGVAGSACYNGATGTFELNGSGNDIWDTQDAFRFAYKTIVGNGEIIARVLDQDNTNVWNKCGIMVRESLAEGSRHAFIAITSGNGVAFQNRTETDGVSYNENTGADIKAPYWLKMIINGSNYTGYMSPDGLTWTQVGNTVNAGFGNGQPVYAGLAITSHDNTTLSTAHVDNYNLGGVLALKLISFTARLALNNTVALEWTTTRESKTNYFVVERTTDNLNYISIDTIYAANNGEFTQNYNATDLHPLLGLNYYRLKIVDAEGKITHSPIAAVKVTNVRSPQIYPNPAKTYVNITQGTDVISEVIIYNVVGKPVAKILNTNAETVIKIPVYSLPGELYLIEIRTKNVVYRDKLIVHN